MGFFVDGQPEGQAPYSVSSIPTSIQSQSRQFTGADDSTGLFELTYASYLQGIYMTSVGDKSMDWVVDVGLPDPDNPGTYVYYNLLARTGVDMVWSDAGTILPAGTRIRVQTNDVVGADLKAQLLYKY